MKQRVFSWALVLGCVVWGGVASLGIGCSSSDDCKDSDCASGNKCIDNGKDVQCRRTCTDQEGCPHGYTCTTNPKADGPAFCAADLHAYPKAAGQWGDACDSTQGVDNPDCDGANGFKCYGTRPADATAFCTQYDCESDADCRGGWWCATVNSKPDLTSPNSSFGDTMKVCMPRTYCATCQSDVDCPTTSDGFNQHCVDGDSGGKFCAPVCQTDAGCALDAYCADGYASELVCIPNAGTCVGDGSFCSPCRSDDDCTDGYCTVSTYTHEHFCTEKSKVACTVKSDGSLQADCPPLPGGVNAKVVSCATSKSATFAKDQCFANVVLGTDPSTGQPQYGPGCYSRNRK